MFKQTSCQAFTRLPLIIGLSFSFLMLALLVLGHRTVTPVRAVGPTVITQNISINTAWIVADSPYIIQTGTVFINNGAALTVEPGVTVQFEDGSRLEIDNGQLIAVGTPSQPITFTALNPSPTRGIWEGIQFNATPVSTIAYALIEYGREAIRIDTTNRPFYILSNTIRYAGDFDGDPATGGAIIGSPDGSFIHNNTIYDSESGIFLNEAGVDVVSYNTIYDIDRHCIVIGLGGTGSGSNVVLNNALHTCGGSGIRFEENSVFGSDNQAFGNIISNTLDGGIFLERQLAAVITGNVIYDVTAGSGLVFSDTHNAINPIHSNAICVDATYEIDDRVNGSQLNAEGNWLGTNTPALGSEVNGNVDFDPWISLAVTPNPTALPADGLSTSVITVIMNDGAGHTVPPFARTVNLVTSLGTLADTSVTLDANGVATTTLTAANTAGTATVTVTDLCNVPVTTTVQFQATDLQISKTTPLTTVTAGGLITYTIAYTNNSAVDAANVIITDTLPLSATYINDVSNPPLTTNGPFGGVITWSIPVLTGGSSGLITLTLQVDPNAPCGSSATTLTNLVDIGSDTAESSVGDNGASSTVPILCMVTSTLQITKTANLPTITPDRDIIYTIEYANTTAFTIENVTITDTLPLSTTFIGSTATANGWSEITSTSVITWNRPNLLPLESGSFTMTVHVDDQPVCSPFSVINRVSIGAQFVSGVTTSTATVNVVCGVDLVVTKNDDIGFGLSDVAVAVPAGDVFTYTISVVNMGTDLATNVVISETIPLFTTFVGPTGPNGWFAAGGRVYTYFVGALDPGDGTVVRLQLRADHNLPPITTTVTNEVCVSSNQPDAIPVDNCDSVDTDLIGFDNQATLSKDDGGLICVIPGQSINYTIRVTNTGTVPATGLALHEALPNNTTFQGPVGTWTMAGPTLFTHTIGTLNGGATDSTPFWVRVDPSTPSSVTAITNVVTLMPQGLSFALTTPLVHDAPDLYVVKNDNIELLPRSTLETIARIEAKTGRSLPWLDALKRQPRSPSAIFVSPGDTISYTVAYGNAGVFTATNVVVTETLPANTQFLGPIGPGGWTQVNANTYIFTVTTLPPGSGGLLDFRVRVDNPFPANTIGVTNTVQIGSDALLECDVSDNISIEFTPVQGVPSGPSMVYLPIVLKNYPLSLPTATPTITPTPGPTGTPVPTATPIPRAWVSDVAVDQNSNRVFIASPRDDAVQVIDGGPDDYIQPVPVGDGPTGLAVLTSTTPSKVFVVHEPDWTPGMWLVDANALTSHSMVDQGGYVGARPVKVAVNSLTNRTYISNYWDKLPFINAFTENLLAYVQKKSFQASYGIRTSQSTNLVYMASIDTGELIIFDAVQSELNPNTYGACHNAPPDDDNNGDADPRNLRMVAVNNRTGHVFVTSPPDLNTGQTDSRVYVLDEAILLGPQGTNGQPPSDTTCLWNFLPNGQRSPTALPGKGWIKTIILPGSSTAGAGHIGIAANPATNKVYVTDGDANKVFVIQDGDNASLSLPVQVINSGFDNPQGVDANPLTNKIYVANARNSLAPYGTVTVLHGDTNAVLEIVPLTGTP